MKSEELYQGSGFNWRMIGMHGLEGFGEGLIQVSACPVIVNPYELREMGRAYLVYSA